MNKISKKKLIFIGDFAKTNQNIDKLLFVLLNTVSEKDHSISKRTCVTSYCPEPKDL